MSATHSEPWDCRLHEVQEQVRPAEQRMIWVATLTLITMVGELVAGYLSGSLALVADGWHMASHAGALGLSAAAYKLARAQAHKRTFVFGTGKVYALAGYTNAVVLAFVAVWMVSEAIERLRHPQPIAFQEALIAATLGLAVNLVSVKLLAHRHDHHHGHDHHGHDHNLRAAYLHVLADALTSLLAIGSLIAGWFWGFSFLDPITALVASVVILRWAVSLCRSAAGQLLDVSPSETTERCIRESLRSIDDVEITDFHLWQLGPHSLACVVSIATATPRDICDYRDKVLAAVALSHLTIEVHRRR